MVVVDTNVVLDWWVFRGGDSVAVLQAILDGTCAGPSHRACGTSSGECCSTSR